MVGSLVSLQRLLPALSILVAALFVSIASPASAAVCPQLSTSGGPSTLNAVFDPATDTCIFGSTPPADGVHLGYYQSVQGIAVSNGASLFTGLLVLNSSSLPSCMFVSEPGFTEFNNAACPAGSHSLEFVATTTAGLTLSFSGSFTCPSTCSFGGTLDMTIVLPPSPADDTVARTMHVITNFMTARANQITASDPDLTDRLDGVAGGGNAIAFAPDGALRSFAYATSLAQVAASDEAFRITEGNEGGGAQDAGLRGASRPLYDAWIEVRGSHFDDDAGDGNVGLLYAGIDRSFGANIVLGIMAQGDWSEQDAAANASADGIGWLAGPYVVVRLHQNVIFDARGAWGLSENNVSPLGTYTDSFDGERWLLRGRLTGDFVHGAWSFRPSVGVTYFEETQEGYTDSLGNAIPGQTVSLGRVSFGPRVGYRWVASNGAAFVPYASAIGFWAFDASSGTAAEALSARFESGIALGLVNGWNVNAAGTFDVGGDDYTAYGGRLSLAIPF